MVREKLLLLRPTLENPNLPDSLVRSQVSARDQAVVTRILPPPLVKNPKWRRGKILVNEGLAPPPVQPPVDEELFPTPYPQIPVGGRQISPLPRSVESDHLRQVGSLCTAGGPGTSLPRTASSVVSSSRSVSNEGSRQKSLAARGDSLTSSQRCNRDSESSSFTRFLLPSFSCSQEKWENETGDRPLRFEPAPHSATFQNGDEQIHQGFNSYRHVDHVSRFDRCVFPHSHFSQFSQIPSLCLGKSGVCFQGNAFWPFYSPLVFTRVFQAVTSHLHSQSILIHSYLDDSLLKNLCHSTLQVHTHLVIELLLKLVG